MLLSSAIQAFLLLELWTQVLAVQENPATSSTNPFLSVPITAGAAGPDSAVSYPESTTTASRSHTILPTVAIATNTAAVIRAKSPMLRKRWCLFSSWEDTFLCPTAEQGLHAKRATTSHHLPPVARSSEIDEKRESVSLIQPSEHSGSSQSQRRHARDLRSRDVDTDTKESVDAIITSDAVNGEEQGSMDESNGLQNGKILPRSLQSRYNKEQDKLVAQLECYQSWVIEMNDKEKFTECLAYIIAYQRKYEPRSPTALIN